MFFRFNQRPLPSAVAESHTLSVKKEKRARNEYMARQHRKPVIGRGRGGRGGRGGGRGGGRAAQEAANTADSEWLSQIYGQHTIYRRDNTESVAAGKSKIEGAPKVSIHATGALTACFTLSLLQLLVALIPTTSDLRCVHSASCGICVWLEVLDIVMCWHAYELMNLKSCHDQCLRCCGCVCVFARVLSFVDDLSGQKLTRSSSCRRRWHLGRPRLRRRLRFKNSDIKISLLLCGGM